MQPTTDDPYSFEPLPTANSSPLPPPLPPRISKWQERAWMVCFWSTFIWSLLQFGLGFLVLSAATPLSPADDEPLTLLVTWIWSKGMFADLFLAGVGSLIAAYAFARARAGKSCIVPVIIWLATRIPILIVLVISFFVLKQADAANFYYSRTRVPWEALPIRVFCFNLPLWIFLFCAGLIWFVRREPPLRTRPTEPFAPWP
jgi:hypothetical protein